MGLFRGIKLDVQKFHREVIKWSATKQMMTVALLASVAALLQSAGGYIPIIGFFISPFTTLPIIIATLITFRHGLFAYGLTIVLLLILEPAELFIFPFTTGLLGLGVGCGLIIFMKRLYITVVNGVLLSIGIFIPLYLLDFPVFGPMTSSAISVKVMLSIFLFSILYSGLWVQISLFFIRRLDKVIR